MTDFRESNSSVHSIGLRDGRVLSYAVYGSGEISAPTILYFYSYPDSLVGGRILAAAAQERGIRIIVPDRPGIGASTSQAKRKITDWPDDVLQLADAPAVAARTFAVLGIAGGAPFVLACCANISSDRLKAAGILNGVYPSSLGLSNYSFGARMYRCIAPWVPSLIARSLESSHGEAVKRDTANRERLEEEVKDETNDVQAMMAAGIRASFEGNGAQAVAQDVSLVSGRWGFDLRDVEMEKGRLVMWHGAKNARNPLDVAIKAHAQLRGSELRVSDGEGNKTGHAMVTERIGEILDTLKERMES